MVKFVDKLLSYFYWRVRSDLLRSIIFDVWYYVFWMPEKIARRLKKHG